MLEGIRKFSASPFGKAVFILILVAFGSGFWYFGNPMAPGEDANWVVRVGDRTISTSTVQGDYQRRLQQLRVQSGGRFDSEQAKQMGLPSLVVSGLINQTLLDQAAAELDLYASDEVVREAILSNAAFQGPTGGFDRNVYAQTLRENGLTERQYEALLRRELERNQLVSSLSAAVVVPKTLLESLYRVENEERTAQVVRIADEAMGDLPAATEDDLESYYQDNPEPFTAPEYRNVAAVILRVEDLAAGMSPSDEEIRTAYADRRDEFRVPERRQLQQMVVATEEEARAARQRVTEGVDFAVVAEEEAGLSADAINVGQMSREQLLPELADAAFSLDVGGVSEPVQSPLGWHLLKVVDIQPAQEQSLDDVRDQLAEDLAREKANDAIYDISNQLQDALGGGATLEEAAAQLDLPLTQVPAVSAEGRDRDGEPVAVPSELVDTAFTLTAGEESLLTEFGTEGYFVVRVDEVIPPALRPLDAVREEVVAAYNAHRKAEAAKTAAADLAKAAEAGQSLVALAREKGFPTETTGPFDRSGRGGGEVPPSLVEALFAAQAGDPVVVRTGNASMVAEVIDVIAAAPPEAAEQGELAGDLEQGISGDLLAQYLDALRERYPVAVNSTVMEQLF